jgi:hypothetical protein
MRKGLIYFAFRSCDTEAEKKDQGFKVADISSCVYDIWVDVHRSIRQQTSPLPSDVKN